MKTLLRLLFPLLTYGQRFEPEMDSTTYRIETYTYFYSGNDSVVYMGTYRKSEVDSVDMHLKEVARPVKEMYFRKDDERGLK